MFDIKIDDNNCIILSGRLDASQVNKANSILNSISESSIVDFTDLEIFQVPVWACFWDYIKD